jgi:formyltetrahydrofolate synthetase
MKTTDTYVDNVLTEAQRLLWSGSLHEVDQAHNMIAELIKTRMSEREGQND